jgi:spore coat polysaccharide biosynthesis predicted glycosyltransferase SpsG
MNKLNICFVVDGGKELGMGHVEQANALAVELKSESEVIFLTKSDEVVCEKIRENGFAVDYCTTDIDILLNLQHKVPDVIIFDKLDVSVQLAKTIKQTLNSRLVIFTNLSRANQYADIAITADIRFENIRFRDENTKTLYYYGPKYWIFRKEFYRYQQQKKEKVKEPKRLLLMFGGSDPSNITTAALEELLSHNRGYFLDVVIGAHYHHEDDLKNVLKRNYPTSSSVNIFRNISNVAELMYKADLVLASPGLSAFEALMVGTPILLVPHDSLQLEEYQNDIKIIERKNLRKLNLMIENDHFTYPTDLNIQQMRIGEGVEELKECILSLTNRSVL